MMQFVKTSLDGAYAIQPSPHKDNRGLFERIFCKEEYRHIGFAREIVQINHSMTAAQGAIRGMHYQNPPKTETKVVKCIKGAVFDVIIDLRKGSPTFLKWHAEVISADNLRMMFIPDGFAHGFQTLERDCELIYFHSQFYCPQLEGAVRYDDPRVGISWPAPVTDISNRDKNHLWLPSDFEGLDSYEL